MSERDLNAPHFPFRAPPGAPPVGIRIVNRFSPLLRPLIRFLLITIPWIPPLIVLIIHFPFEIDPVTGSSMTPFLNGDHHKDEPNTNDVLLVNRFDSVKSTIRRGMVVVYRCPYDPYKVAVKRVVAVQGDRVIPLSGYAGQAEPEPVTVPWGHIWVEGDVEERAKSRDSNWFGPISLNLIIGRAEYILWPLKHFAGIKWQDARLPLDRLEYNAVSLKHPDEERMDDLFSDGYAEGILARLRNPEVVDHVYDSKKGRDTLKLLLRISEKELENKDPETEQLAKALSEEIRAKLHEKAVKVSTKPMNARDAYRAKQNNKLPAPFVQPEAEEDVQEDIPQQRQLDTDAVS